MNTNNQPSKFDRRNFLKGVGVSLSLPFMDSLASPAVSGKPPVRMAFMYMPHGVIMDQFWPENQEEFLKASPSIIQSLKSKQFNRVCLVSNFG